MKALDRKLLRDLTLMWSQALTIALVVGSGIGGFITMLSAVDSLTQARDDYYTAGRFADVFAGVKRAPSALVEVLRAIPGVADVQTTTEMAVRVEIQGRSDPIIVLDSRQPARMNREALNRALGEGDLSTGYVLAIERGREVSLLDATKALPRVAGAFGKASMLRNMQEISARNIRIMSTVLTLFACVIAVGVVYNNARIARSERTWELASLRVLGFTRAEVSGLLLGEMAIVIAIALPLGMGLGYALVHTVVDLLKSDQFFFPVVIRARTYAWAAIASALIVRRRIDRLDLVAALKTRE